MIWNRSTKPMRRAPRILLPSPSTGRSSATGSGTCCGQAGRWKRCARAKRKTVPFCSLATPHQGASVCLALCATKPDKEGKLMRQRRWPVQHEGRTSPSDVKTSLAEPESPPGLRERARQIEAEQVRLLYTQAPTGCVATVLNAGIVTFVLWKVVAHPLLIAWLALLIAIILSLFVLLWMYHRATPTADRSRLWHTLFVIGAGSGGTVGGAAGILLFPYESLVHQVFLVFVLGGMAAGAVAVLSPVMAAFLAAFIPTLFPITVQLFLQGDAVHVPMGLLLLSFAGVLLSMARHQQ